MSLNITRIDTSRPESGEAIRRVRRRLSSDSDIVSEAGRKRTLEVFGEPLSPRKVVERICRDVRDGGLDAVLEYSAKLDRVELNSRSIRVSEDELAAAHGQAEPIFLDCIRRIRDNVLAFQTAILHHDVRIDTPDEGYLRQRYTPLARVGICVPGGAAAYPSTILMTAVPAQAAGVSELAIVAPPTQFGSYNPHILATCHELGIKEVYRIGGAQGVAALAYGLRGLAGEPLRKVDKIVGPGNLFVALAKKHVYGDVDIDSIAGPSEVIVVADDSNRADWTAADLIAQAEHAPGSSILITWSEALLDEVAAELERQLRTLARGELARQSLEEFGALILVRDRDEAAELAEQLATEHLHLACEDGEDMLEQIRSAGAVFIGPLTPVALGDYVAGPSHVLPTGATARFASGLSANQFLRSSSVIHFTQLGLDQVAGDVELLAAKEGLPGHAASVALRRSSPS
jgi:histidinol dehydrogenase